MISIDLSGKSILITGALGATAEFMVRKLVAAGATLILLDIRPEEETRRTLELWNIPPVSYTYFQTDITDSAALSRVVSESFRRFPALDTVLGHAGGCGLHPFATTPEADYDRIFRFNYFAQVNLARALFAQWVERKISGHLIFTSSYVARMPHTQIASLRIRQSGVGDFRSLHGVGVRVHRHSRQCGFARERGCRQFAEGLRRRSRLPRIRAASFPWEEEILLNPSPTRSCSCVRRWLVKSMARY